jgi:hypothetical protein
VNIAALSPSEIVNMRGFWDGLPDAPPDLPKPAADPAAQSLTNARNLLARSLASTTSEEMTAAIGPFVRPDRVPPDVALAYAAQADSKTLAPRAATGRRVNNQAPAAVVTNRGVASVAIKPAETIARSHLDRTAERLNDPWMRGLVLAKSVQHSLTVTIVGDPDFRSLAPHLRQPPSAVMMTFSHDPHLGMTADAFTGSAVVFQATVTFGDRRTASLQ